MKMRLLFLLAAAGIILSTFSFAQTKKLNVTLIANEGFLISSASKTVLIDALFSYGYNYFQIPDKNSIEDILNGKPPFDKINLNMITHGHGDHMDANLVDKFLQVRKDVPVICSGHTIDTLKKYLGATFSPGKNVYEVTPALNNSIQKDIDGIPVEAIALQHLSNMKNGVDMNAGSNNISFLFDMDGIKVFHSGDIMKNAFESYFAEGKKWERKCDIAFLFYGLFANGEADLDYILKILNPKAIVVTHVPPRKYDEWLKKCDELRKVLPGIYLFKDQMESKSILME